MVNLDYHQSVAECHPNLVIKFVYLKDLDDVDPFNINGVYGGGSRKQGKVGLYFTTLLAYKTPFVINLQPLTVSLSLGEGVSCNTIFH